MESDTTKIAIIAALAVVTSSVTALTRIMHHAARFCTSDAEARATAPTG